ncbi:hypothetical protein FPZ12_020195 [Amycolatopsis acidicola]|uniref:ParA family protein n=1 Tax=Amycolatopsis acidicola TaxID=2596893 RepID=A0A5N0UZG6_9PSEU|nr:hypothetical protein [Amycolatopsis acidicola]KAA9159428.1 hypothetical protein FPZ12_020195 [Amycolatopsis acidicola]
MITIVSGKGSPGATTTLAALAAGWPAPVLLADCDPAGGDLATGWLGQWIVDGAIRSDIGVLSHATATRHATSGDPGTLAEHVQAAPPARHVGLVAGLNTPGQHAAVGSPGWTRLTVALAAFETAQGFPADALVDVGRYGPLTPWPLLLAADLVLVAVRPTQRHVLAARSMLTELGERIAPDRLGLAVCASTSAATREVRAALGREIAIEMPTDARGAAVFSDGLDAGALPRRSPLLRSARRAARRLHGTYHTYTPAELRAPAPPTLASLIGGGSR